MSVRLGIIPIGWSNDDLPELGGDIPLDTCLAEAREAGFEVIELGHKFPRDPALLRPLLARRGLRLISGWYSGRLLERSGAEELEAVEPHRALLAAMGCTVLVYAETTGGIAGDRTRPLSSRPSLPEGGWREFAFGGVPVERHGLLIRAVEYYCTEAAGRTPDQRKTSRLARRRERKMQRFKSARSAFSTAYSY
jgi:sugar phosphate isomerase/epimerase